MAEPNTAATGGGAMVQSSHNSAATGFIEQYMQSYDIKHAEEVAKFIAELIEAKIEQSKQGSPLSEVVGFVRYRAKTKKSLEDKIIRANAEWPIQSLKHIADHIWDLSGVRIILYTPNQKQHEEIETILKALFEGCSLQEQTPRKRTQDADDALSYEPIHLGYRGKHYTVALETSLNVGNKQIIRANDRVEIQVTSVLGHAWSEAEHDVIYKSYAYGKVPVDEHRIFDALNGLLLSGDLLLQQLYELRTKRGFTPITNEDELRKFLRSQSDLLGAGMFPPVSLIPQDYGKAILELLTLRRENCPFAIRRILRDLGYPHNACLAKTLALRKVAFVPHEDRQFLVCFSTALILPELGLTPENPLIERYRLPGATYTPRKINLIRSALFCMRDMLGEDSEEIHKLLYNGRMTQEEAKGVLWALLLPGQYLMTSILATSELVTYKGEPIDQANVEFTQLAWRWLVDRARDSHSIFAFALCYVKYSTFSVKAKEDIYWDRKMVAKFTWIGSTFEGRRISRWEEFEEL